MKSVLVGLGASLIASRPSCHRYWTGRLNSIFISSAAAVNIAKILLGAKPVASCPEGKSGYSKREKDCDHYNDAEFLEESEVAE